MDLYMVGKVHDYNTCTMKNLTGAGGGLTSNLVQVEVEARLLEEFLICSWADLQLIWA